MNTLLRFFLVLLFALPAAATPVPLDDYPPIFQVNVRRMLRAFNDRDFEAAEQFAAKAEEQMPGTYFIMIVRGAIAIEHKDFEKGRQLCEAALKMEPTLFAARFNLAEIDFVQKKYAAARETYQKLLEGKNDPSESDLVRLRILLTYLLEKNFAEADKMIEQIPLYADTPIHYHAHAAREFAKGNEKEAMRWVESARFVFKSNTRRDFESVFYDIGWIKRDADKATLEQKPEEKIGVKLDTIVPEVKAVTPAK